MNEILIIVIMYNKKIRELPFIENFNFLESENIDIFVYDNSNKPQDMKAINNINFYYIHDSENSGISKGYNAGIQKAKELNKQCVLLLDQDTKFNLSLLEKYMSLYDKHGDDCIYAPIICNKLCNKIYSPSILNRFIGKVQKIENFSYSEIYDLTNQSIINSGMMIPMKIIDKIGGFNEKIKLDFSDFYFIEKYKHFNNNIVLLNERIIHSLSGDEGKDHLKEIYRYKYYCLGARELNKSLNVSTSLAAMRRMIGLIIKYKNLKPIAIFFLYYIKGNKI